MSLAQKIMSHMISHHFMLVIQVATVLAEVAKEEMWMETGVEAVVEEVVAGGLLIPWLQTISLSL